MKNIGKNNFYNDVNSSENRAESTPRDNVMPDAETVPNNDDISREEITHENTKFARDYDNLTNNNTLCDDRPSCKAEKNTESENSASSQEDIGDLAETKEGSVRRTRPRQLTTEKIVMTAMFMALAVVTNVFALRLTLRFKYSAIITIYFLSGAVLGPFLGFFVGFAGDLLGFLIHPDGIYNVLIGISEGLFCLIPGLFMRLNRGRKAPFAEVALASFIVCYIVCTLLITSFGIWLLSGLEFRGKYGTFLAWMGTRAGTQLPNTVVNFVIVLLLRKPLSKIKYFNNLR